MKPMACRAPAAYILRRVSASNGCQLRMPTYTGSGWPAAASRCPQSLGLSQGERGDRRHAAEEIVMVRHLVHTLRRHAPSAEDSLEKRTDVVRTVRTAERHDQDGIEHATDILTAPIRRGRQRSGGELVR